MSTSLPDSSAIPLNFGADTADLVIFANALKAYDTLIREVSRSANNGESIGWSVKVESGSVCVPAFPMAEPEVAQRVKSALLSGLRQLTVAPERPDHFSDKALEETRRLAQLASADLPIGIGWKSDRVGLTEAVAANVYEIIKPSPRPHFGSVEGNLEELNVHDGRKFQVWDRITGQKVQCVAGETLTVEDLVGALEKRVLVRGQFETVGANKAMRLSARSIRVFRPDDELPELSEFRGILKPEA